MKEFEPTNRDEILDWLIFEAGPEGAEMLTHARKDMRRSARPLRGLLSKSIGLNRSLTIAQMALDYSRALLKTVDPCDWIYYERDVPELKIAKANAMEATENYKYITNAKKLQALVRKPVEGKAAIKNVIMKMLEVAVEIEGECGPADFQVGLTKNSLPPEQNALDHWERLVKDSKSLRTQHAAMATYVLVAIDHYEFSLAAKFITPAPRSLDSDIAAILFCNALSLAIATRDYSLGEHTLISIPDFILDTRASSQILKHVNEISRTRLGNDSASLRFQTLLQEKLLR